MEKKKEVIISNKIKCKKCEDIIESKIPMTIKGVHVELLLLMVVKII